MAFDLVVAAAIALVVLFLRAFCAQYLFAFILRAAIRTY